MAGSDPPPLPELLRGNWYGADFGNDGQSPWREISPPAKVDFMPDGKITIADEQPAWPLHEGGPTQWRITP